MIIEFPWEDNLLERKTESDLKDLLKTLVAFSNSIQPGHKAVLLIGEKGYVVRFGLNLWILPNPQNSSIL